MFADKKQNEMLLKYLKNVFKPEKVKNISVGFVSGSNDLLHVKFEFENGVIFEITQEEYDRHITELWIPKKELIEFGVISEAEYGKEGMLYL